MDAHVQTQVRDRGIANLRAITIGAAIGAGVLTAVFSAIAWSTVPGHASPQLTASSGGDPGRRTHRHDGLPPSNGFAPSNGPTYVVTGGSR